MRNPGLVSGLRKVKRLEHTGLAPDELLLPSADALANERDPVLAETAEKLDIKIGAEEAGEAFPYEWPPVECGGEVLLAFARSPTKTKYDEFHKAVGRLPGGRAVTTML